MAGNDIDVIKASGSIEKFHPGKLKASLLRAGASKELAEEILERVLRDIEPFTSTRKIYNLAKKYLQHSNHASGLRYSLKRALFRLGPTGYPFEKYFGEVLRHYGYSVKTGTMVSGTCVKHEVDVLAVNEKEVAAIECKYHNTAQKASDVKVAMYVHSRFRDLEPSMSARYPEKRFRGWLVTNTRCTVEAVRYAECSGIKIVSWKYPKGRSLENMIEEKLLYPVTIISGIKTGLIDRLIAKNIILLKDLVTKEVEDIQSHLALSATKARALKRQAAELCSCQ